MTLLWPIALAGLAALAPLAALYLFQRRASPREVSSLLLWDHLARLTPAGRRVDRWRRPLSLLLECLVIVLLVLAAADPLLRVREAPPVVLVLDDSFSMLATDASGTSARDRALERVAALLERSATVLPVLAGHEPRLLAATEQTGLSQALDAWRCVNRESDLPAAVALAREIAGPQSRVLVLSDAPPVDALAGVRWISVGASARNAAIVAAVRNPSEIVIDIANFSDAPLARSLTLSTPDGSDAAERPAPIVPGGQTARVRIPVSENAGTVRVALDATDALAIDDAATLAPPTPRRVPVRLDVQSEALRDALASVVRVLPNATLTGDAAIVTISDRPSGASVVFHAGTDAEPPVGYSGSFLVDESHPLGEGVDLAGAVWAAPASLADAPLPGRAVILGRSTVLASVDADGTVHVALDIAASNLPRHPAWPTLVWNIVQLSVSDLPGPDRDNVALRDLVRVNVDPSLPTVHTDPDGAQTTLAPVDGRVETIVSSLGAHSFTSGARTHTVGVSALDAAESDLRALDAFDSGEDSVARADALGTRSFAWILALAALAVLLWHAGLTMRRAGAPR